MPTLGDFVHTQFILKIPKPTASFVGKTVIVTGANGGLGKETVKHIIRLGVSKVIFGCRSQSRGKKAKSEIEGLLKCSDTIIEVWEVDLESPSSIKNFVDRANTLPRLDVVINNAGMQTLRFSVVYGTERTLAVNFIGTFLLAVQLIPKLRETAREYRVTPHMTFLSSALYDVAKYPEKHGDDIFAWFRDKSHVNPINQYNLSKLLQLYATIRLSAMVGIANSTEPNPIVINSLDPCFCKTGLPGELKGALRIFVRIFEAIAARTAEEGARLVVQAAAAGRETHGLYMRAGVVQKYAPNVLDNDKATYVWELLCKKLEELQPGVLRSLD
ncbi:NAD(P)-binding protein [Coniochaeta sp. PMI_546]|nr:NAD(P)-binding protein [Coniochaeta sp. PMI_546]